MNGNDLDLDAISEDVAMAARSPEMARHVALDHTPHLISRIRELDAEMDEDTGVIRALRRQRDEAEAKITEVWEIVRAYYDDRVTMAEAMRKLDETLGAT